MGIGKFADSPKERLQIGSMMTFHDGGHKSFSVNSYYDRTLKYSRRFSSTFGVTSLSFRDGGYFDVNVAGPGGTTGRIDVINALSINRNADISLNGFTDIAQGLTVGGIGEFDNGSVNIGSNISFSSVADHFIHNNNNADEFGLFHKALLQRGIVKSVL
jgi:hypothetical protein